MTGSIRTEFNLSPLPDLVITGAKTLTYTVAGSPANDTGGTAVLDLQTNAVDFIQLKAITEGADGNLDLNAPVTLEQPISGVLDTAHVTAAGLSGGVDQEGPEPLRSRYLEELRNPVAHFNVAEITATAKLINGVTRVWVVEAVSGGTPDLGQVQVYFMRDGDTGTGIPDATEVLAVKTALIGGTTGGTTYPGIKPANTSSVDVFVSAPTAVSQAFTFTALSPDSTTMRTAIAANLAQFFAEEVEPSADVVAEAYTAAIQNTVDPATGLKVASFTATPTADVTIVTGEIGVLGTITWSI